MNVRDIVRKAWQITQVHLKKLIWYGFTPAFFGVIVSSVYLAYQYNALKHSVLFNGDASDYYDAARVVWTLVTSHPAITITTVVLAVIIVFGYIIVPPIFAGILIDALMKIKRYESIEGCVEVGVRHFFPMFEFAIITGAFSVTTLFTESSFILRWWGPSLFFIALPVLLFIAMAGLVINFLFTYSEYFIVLENKGLTRSVMESTVLVIANLKKTFLIFVLMLLIGARIILNVILVLLVPMLVVGLASYFATIFLTTIGLILIGVVGLIILIVSSYLLGLFHVFAAAVWVLTFAELREGRHHTKERDKVPGNHPPSVESSQPSAVA